MNNFIVDTKTVLGPNTQFWKAAGSDKLFWHIPRPDGQILLDRMSDTSSCRYLRNHFTFSDIVKFGVQLGGQVYSEDGMGNPCYDFSKMNYIFGEMVKRGIKPIVEYDFFPEALSSKSSLEATERAEGLNMGDHGPKDWEKWKDLMTAFTENLLATFGAEEIRSWYFEVWNEPDHWPIDDLPTFFRMYDEFVDAVTSVDDKLKVGGPACFHTYFLRDFLNHVANGKNYVTGKIGTRIDFISYHIYGLSGSWLKEHPLVQPTVQRFIQELLWIQRLVGEFPSLKNVEFHLNEWGVCSNWNRTVDEHPALQYRNSEFSALFLVKLVHCLFAIEDAYNFPTSMLLYWGFSGEASGDRMFLGQRELTTAGNVPKPIQTAHEILALLGTQRIRVVGPKPGGSIGLMATGTGENEIQFIAYNFNELDENSEGFESFEVRLDGLRESGLLDIKGYFLDREYHNTYRTWQKQGSPSKACEADLDSLFEISKLKPDFDGNIKIEAGTAYVRFEIPKCGMKLFSLHIK